MKTEKQRTVADLKKGEKGIIKGFTDQEMSLKLLEMGCLVDTEIKMEYVAPFGDPVCIGIGTYQLSMRLAEAQTLILD